MGCCACLWTVSYSNRPCVKRADQLAAQPLCTLCGRQCGAERCSVVQCGADGALSMLPHGACGHGREGYTVPQPAGWSGRAGWHAAWRWRGGTRSAFAAGRLPGAHSRCPGTQTPYSGSETRGKGTGKHFLSMHTAGLLHLLACAKLQGKANSHLMMLDGGAVKCLY